MDRRPALLAAALDSSVVRGRVLAISDRLPNGLALFGLLWAGLSLLDRARPAGRLWGPVLAAAALGLQSLRGRPAARLVFVAVLSAAFGFCSWARPQMQRADFVEHFCYLRSAVFDRDLDFANEWRHWDLDERPRTTTGHRYNQHTLGAALVWSPFFLLSHLYVVIDRALGTDRWEADGYSVPYERSAAMGTLVASVLGAWLLGQVLASRLGTPLAALAVLAAVATSPVVYYMFFQPGMAHGAVFGLGSMTIWAWDRVRRQPSLQAWVALGALLGLLIATRLQEVAYVLLLAPLALGGLARGTTKPAWLLAGAAASLLAFSPQMIAWKILYGTFLWIPRGPGILLLPSGGWFDATSPRFLDVFVHADHGLLVWTPAMILGVAGMLLALRSWGSLAAGGLMVLLATAWLNGSFSDWAGGDAFAARRFDGVVPFMAFGFATLLELCRRAPLLAPALGLLLMALWNFGLIGLYRGRALGDALPLEYVAARQARQFRQLSEKGLDALAGPRGRALIYKALVGEFLYWNLNPDGVIDLAKGEPRYLAGGWSGPENQKGPPSFRWALYPQSCIRFPLEAPARDLDMIVTARAPGRLQGQTMTLVLNQAFLKRTELDRDWSDVAVTLPMANLVPGENTLCLQFGQGLPGNQVAAAVSRIKLP